MTINSQSKYSTVTDLRVLGHDIFTYEEAYTRRRSFVGGICLRLHIVCCVSDDALLGSSEPNHRGFGGARQISGIWDKVTVVRTVSQTIPYGLQTTPDTPQTGILHASGVQQERARGSSGSPAWSRWSSS